VNILVITSRVPFPPHRGDKLRIFNIIKTLAKHHKVTVVTNLFESSEENDVAGLKAYGVNVETVRFSKLRSRLNLFKSFYTNNPLQVSYYHSKRMGRKIKELTTAGRFDVAYFHLLITAQYHNAVADENTLKVLDLTDATSLYLTRYLQFLKKPLQRLYFRFDLYKTLNYERIVRFFDTIFVCSNVDKEYLVKRNIHDNIRLFMNGFDIDTFHYRATEPEKTRIIFTGNMPYFPNRDGVLFFTREIFPLVLRRVPGAIFYIVGQNPPEEIQELRSENIVVTGLVPDIREEYIKSTVNIAPIRLGAGTPNKIIEAMALGVPTVATSFTIEGFPGELKKYLFVADTAGEFADRIVEILTNRTAYENMMNEAAVAIHNLLGADNVMKEIEEYLNGRINLIKRK
jgi:sugar transferase (PEP-CTERM/EpsH1 system associated)